MLCHVISLLKYFRSYRLWWYGDVFHISMLSWSRCPLKIFLLANMRWASETVWKDLP